MILSNEARQLERDAGKVDTCLVCLPVWWSAEGSEMRTLVFSVEYQAHWRPSASRLTRHRSGAETIMDLARFMRRDGHRERHLVD